jgi:hypothetical protein
MGNKVFNSVLKKLFTESGRVMNVKNLTWGLSLHFFRNGLGEALTQLVPL